MDMPTVTAEKLIKSANFNWVDSIYRGSIPEEVIDNTDTTVINITEWLSEPGKYANQSFKWWTIGVGIQIFFKKGKQAMSLIDAEIELARLFQKNNWSIDQSKNNVKDPGTEQMSQVFLFSKNILLKEGN